MKRFVFGRSQRSYDLLKKDMQDKSVVSAGNLIVTNQFMLLFSKHIFNMCKVIQRMLLTVLKILFMELLQSLQNIHCIFMTGILSAIPLYWMRSNQRPDTRQRRRFVRHIRGFMQSVVILFLIARCLKTAENFLNQIEKRKYEMNSTVNVDKEAEAEIDQMVNDARRSWISTPSSAKIKRCRIEAKIKGTEPFYFCFLNHTEKRLLH